MSLFGMVAVHLIDYALFGGFAFGLVYVPYKIVRLVIRSFRGAR